MVKVKYNLSYSEDMVVSISNGNSKIGKGDYTFNMLPGDSPITKKDGTVLTNVCGTCAGVCNGCKSSCYAMKGAIVHNNSVIPSNGKNTLIMRNNMDKGFEQIKAYCVKNNVKVFRYHSSGEILNYEYLLHMHELAKELPDVQFYTYTKRFDCMDNYLKEHELLNNLVINISEWNHNTDGYDFSKLNKFVWDDGTDPEIAKLPHCPSVSKPTTKGGKGHMREGIHCITCGLCFKANTGRRLAVYNH